jgi:hypothetical protein
VASYQGWTFCGLRWQLRDGKSLCLYWCQTSIGKEPEGSQLPSDISWAALKGLVYWLQHTGAPHFNGEDCHKYFCFWLVKTRVTSFNNKVNVSCQEFFFANHQVVCLFHPLFKCIHLFSICRIKLLFHLHEHPFGRKVSASVINHVEESFRLKSIPCFMYYSSHKRMIY